MPEVFLVRGKYVVLGVTESGDGRVVEDGAVLVDYGRIADVGRYEDLAKRHAGQQVVGGRDCVVIPGFVNAHHHVGLTPFQLGTNDDRLEHWMVARAAAPDVDPYLDTVYAALDMVSSGITTVQHIHGRLPGPAEEWARQAALVLRAYQDVGLRVTYCFSSRDQNFVTYDDSRFETSLPPELADRFRAHIARLAVPIDEQLGVISDLRARWVGDERMRFQLSPANLHWCSDSALREITEYARKEHLRIHMHILETPYQKEYAWTRFGMSAIEYLHERGVLGPDVTLAHAVWVTDSDIEILASSGTMVCHDPSSNLRLGSGVAPVPSLVRRGVPLAIGIDEAGLNDDRDMFLELRLALALSRLSLEPDHVLSAGGVFRIATEFGGKSAGFTKEIGTLDVGRNADLAILSWESIASPYLDSAIDPVDAVIRRAKPLHVQTVVVGGKLIYLNGEFTGVDRTDVLGRIARDMSRQRTTAERGRGEVAHRLGPYLRNLYKDRLPNKVSGSHSHHHFNARE